VNGGCLLRNQAWSVEIDMRGIQASDMNTTEVIVEINTLTGLDIQEVGLEIGDEAYIIHVVLIIKDQETGLKIVDAVKEKKESFESKKEILDMCSNEQKNYESTLLKLAFPKLTYFKLEQNAIEPFIIVT